MLLVAFCMLHRQQALLQECDFPSAVACIERSLEICDDLPVCKMHHAPCSIRHATCTRPSCVSTPVAFAITTDGARNHRCNTTHYVATCRTMLQQSVLCCNIVLCCMHYGPLNRPRLRVSRATTDGIGRRCIATVAARVYCTGLHRLPMWRLPARSSNKTARCGSPSVRSILANATSAMRRMLAC